MENMEVVPGGAHGQPEHTRGSRGSRGSTPDQTSTPKSILKNSKTLLKNAKVDWNDECNTPSESATKRARFWKKNGGNPDLNPDSEGSAISRRV